MTVRVLATSAELAWNDYVRRHPQATFFHQLAWRDAVVESFPHRPHYLVAEEGGRLQGVLPLFETRSPLLGRALVSVPYGVYGGVIADDAAVAAELLAASCRRAEEVDARFVELRHFHAPALDLPRNDLYVTFLRDLPDDPDQCLEMIPRKSRAAARHARDRHGMVLEEGPHLLDAFYELFVQNKRSLGSPVFARRWFAGLLARLEDDVLVHAVRHEGQVIAAVVSFVFRDVLMPYYSGAVPQTERLGSMNFLYWRLMEVAVRRGLKRYDFGRSRAASGAAAFKRNMGFEPTPLAYQYHLRNGTRIPEVNPSNPRFDRFKHLWSRLPVPVVKVVGPRLMRYLP